METPTILKRARHMTRKYPDLQNVASDQIATGYIPASGVHKRLFLEFRNSSNALVTKAQVEAEIENIKIVINGIVFVDCTPSELHMLQKFYQDRYGADVIAGVTQIDWDRRHLNLPGDRKPYGLGMADVTSFTIEIKAGTLTNIAKVTPYVELTNEQAVMGTHKRLVKYARNFAGTGDFEVTDFPKKPDSAFSAIHIALGSGTLTDTTLNVDDLELHRDLSPAINQAVVESYGRNPQSGYEHLCFDLQGGPVDFLEMVTGGKLVQDVRLKTNWSVAPDAHSYLVERIDNLPALG
jgi:hypothetical protein